MNRAQRRRAEREAERTRRTAAITATVDYLANVAAPTATGATLILPDGEVLYLDVETARAMMAGKSPGRTQ